MPTTVGYVPATLHTDRLVLRAADGSDSADLDRLLADPRVCAFLGQPTRSVAQLLGGNTHMWVASLANGAAPRVPSAAAPVFVGMAAVRQPRHSAHADAELTYLVTPHLWGQGYASEITSAVLTRIFDDLPVARVVATVAASHLASRRVLTKVGLRPHAAYGDVIEYHRERHDSPAALKSA